MNVTAFVVALILTLSYYFYTVHKARSKYKEREPGNTPESQDNPKRGE